MGCHETRPIAPPPEAGIKAFLREPSVPLPPPWGDRPVSFLRDVQPVLDKQCVSCHTGTKPAAGVDLSGGLTASYNRAYETLVPDWRQPGLVSFSNKFDPASRITEPYAFGSHKSKLLAVIRDEYHQTHVQLGREELQTLITWIDCNAVYHDRFIDKRSASSNLGSKRHRRLENSHLRASRI